MLIILTTLESCFITTGVIISNHSVSMNVEEYFIIIIFRNKKYLLKNIL